MRERRKVLLSCVKESVQVSYMYYCACALERTLWGEVMETEDFTMGDDVEVIS